MRIQLFGSKSVLGCLAYLALGLPFCGQAQSAWTNDGAVSPFLNGNLPQVSPAGFPYRTVRAFPNVDFVDPSAMRADPVADRFYISERVGRIYLIENDETITEKHLVLDIRSNVPVLHDSGLYNFVLDADFETNGFLYALYTWKDAATPDAPLMNRGFNDKYLRLSRFKVDLATFTIDPQTELTMIQIRLLNLSHRGSGMVFGADGFLYLSIGEMIRHNDAQNITTTLHGGILRLDVRQQGGDISHAPRRRMGSHSGQADEISGVGYYIPKTNPFLDENGTLFEEYYTVGNRNPYRMTQDRVDGHIWIANVGDQKEEINLLEWGGNYQWPVTEGKNDQDVMGGSIIGHEVSAFYELDRTLAKCLIGGFVYRGTKFPDLNGKYLAGDYVNGILWGMDLDLQTREANHTDLAEFGQLVGFGEDARHGDIYFFKGNTDGNFSSGIYRLEDPIVSYPIPTLLSETGAFNDLNTLEPVEGLLEYEPASPLWSDGAEKRRWVGVPNDGNRDELTEQIAFNSTSGYEFPIGTTFVKHFELEGMRIETRFLTVDEQDEWYGLTYRWLSDQSDAVLVESEGLDEVLEVGGKQYAWHYPSRTECFSCHTEVADYILGFKTSQLNVDRLYADLVPRNQLSAMNEIQLFQSNLSGDPLSSYARSVGLGDTDATLDHRVRSYLDSNCSHCHQPGGPDGHSTWNGLLDVSLTNRHLIGNPVYGGAPHEWVVVPGMPDHSQLLERLRSLDSCCAMPPIGKNRVDEEAVQQVAAWIRTLSPGSWPEWSTMHVEEISSFHDADFNGVFAAAVDVVGSGGFQIGSASFASSDEAGVNIVSDYSQGPEVLTPSFGESVDNDALESLFSTSGVSDENSIIYLELSDLPANKRLKLQLFMMAICCYSDWTISISGEPPMQFSAGMYQSGEFNGTRGVMLTYNFSHSNQSVAVQISSSEGVARLSGLTVETIGDATDVDTDKDTIPDYWEILHAKELSVLGDGDWDKDGISDIGEFQSGTRPMDASDRLRIVSIVPEVDSIGLTLQSSLGKAYAIEWSTNLLDWTVHSSGYLGDELRTYIRVPTTSPPEVEGAFFRVGAE